PRRRRRLPAFRRGQRGAAGLASDHALDAGRPGVLDGGATINARPPMMTPQPPGSLFMTVRVPSVFVVLAFASLARADGVAVDRAVERTLKAFEVPGIAVGVVKDGKLI